MTTDFELQLEQMLPAILASSPKKARSHSLAKIAVGFLLGVCVTYGFLQPNDAPQRAEPQETFMLVLDESNLDQLRRPADVFQLVVRQPVRVQPWEDDQSQWRYGTLRESLTF